MSLMRLLTNGKTLVDLKHSTSRYHIPTKSFLPKFGPVKNPFTPPSRSAATSVATVAPSPVVEIQAPAAKIAPPQLKETQRLPVLPVKMKETKRLPFVASRKNTPPQAPELAWWEKFLDWAGVMMAKPAQWLAKEKAPAKSAIPRFDKPVEQGELSLENIKVVRNDLNDADMDVVPARTFTSETNFKPALQPQVPVSASRLTLTETSVA